MDSDVVLPVSSFDIEAEKPLEVIQEEQDQKVLERYLAKEAQRKEFPMIRQHIETLIDQFNDMRALALLPDAERSSQAVGRAFFVDQMYSLLAMIDTALESQDTMIQEELKEKAGKSGTGR